MKVLAHRSDLHFLNLILMDTLVHGQFHSLFTSSLTLSASFSREPTISNYTLHPPNISVSHSAPEASQMGSDLPKRFTQTQKIHSRNLSSFLSPTGSTPQGTINEDDSQELEIPLMWKLPGISNIAFLDA